ncbi:MBL fold metallo-hydrolase [Domibacillus epiphyticus]|uniref:MBL fold metallo-hydrolase n=1 Tax=Domibacillus epiphyticus TaxID=1714355 RepID=A0A1V2A581_9BACI|nr:MBL fold metallo-hydrolase [Domibacillus epiphyticus]OMP66143.1 MBL fold metallo-hydrolase [Domibacillus epiphyticus]
MEKSASTEQFLPFTSIKSGAGNEIANDVFCFTVQIVNVCFIGNPDKSSEWILIDAGMPDSAESILLEAEKRFGPDHRLKAIVLTHGHFDHVGAVIDLIEKYKVPVYAHKLEFPYLTGKKNYPKPDPSVEGGLVAKMSPLFPNESIDIGEYLTPLPNDKSVPHMAGWNWVHTPGHTEGHISLFREDDGTLLAGDAFVTVRQDSLYKVITQKQELSGPPRYFTTDWQAAWESVKKLESLHPSVAVTGHGMPMSGELLRIGLKQLSNEFDKEAIPDFGRYADGQNEKDM